MDLIDRFEQAYQLLLKEFGAKSLHKGTMKRFFKKSGENKFIAETVLGAYLLIFLVAKFKNEFDVKRILNEANPGLSKIISGLPPWGGGGIRMSEIMNLPGDA